MSVQDALIDVRVFPWRPRTRKMAAEEFRKRLNPFDALTFDDPGGLVVGLALGVVIWLALFIAAPLIVVVLAVALFSVELPIVLLLALALIVIRFAGIVPWTVVIVDRVTGTESTEKYRSIVRAVARVREVNAGRRVSVRWAWA